MHFTITVRYDTKNGFTENSTLLENVYSSNTGNKTEDTEENKKNEKQKSTWRKQNNIQTDKTYIDAK